jgi:acetyl-CoA carboxylase biotin carboxylase subunit
MNRKKVLIANRGEIAIRILRACREVGLSTVAIYSEPDRHSLHVRYADEAYCVGPAPSIESYLAIDRIIDVAKRSGVHMIHPGYGFLAENSEFAKRCEKEGIIFIGPLPKTIEDMGDKITARKTMINAGIPIVPGTIESIKSDEEAYKIAREIGYPIMLKAAAGGGGKGLRLIKDEGDMKSGLRATKSEALSSFGNDEIYIEKYLENPRHVEFQILADKYGNIIHLYDRECSIQRRHQKVIEESPAPAIDNNRRLEMGEYAVRAAKAVNYVGAGTIEFLVDEEKNFYFLEMNTRLQVEHPVTEMVTGIDIVKLQLEIAMDKRINIKQEDIKQRGSAIECRIYAEDPENNFLPSPGLITKLRIPGGPGIRDDGGVYEGYEVPIYYDPLISKLIVWGRDRLEAINRMRRALQEYIIKGIRTTIPFHLKVMESEKFIKGDINTNFIDMEFLKEEKKLSPLFMEVAIMTSAIVTYRKDKEIAKQLPDESSLSVSPWKIAGRRAAMNRL